MCTGVEIMMVAGMAASASSTFMGMQAADEDRAAAYQKAYYDKEMAEYNAERMREQSRQKAERIFEAARRLRGEQMVSQAASGAVIGEGSAAAMLDETAHLAARDAIVALYNGIEAATGEEQEGEMQFRAGVSAAKAAGRRKTATLISGIGSLANQYHTSRSLRTVSPTKSYGSGVPEPRISYGHRDRITW